MQYRKLRLLFTAVQPDVLVSAGDWDGEAEMLPLGVGQVLGLGIRVECLAESPVTVMKLPVIEAYKNFVVGSFKNGYGGLPCHG